MKRVTGARVALIVVLGALVLSIAAFGTGYATHKGEEHGNSSVSGNHDAAAVEDTVDEAAAADDAAAADTAAANNGNGNGSSKKSTTTQSSGTQAGTTQSSGTQGSGKTNPDPAPSPSRPATTGDLTCDANKHVGGSGANGSGYYDSRCDGGAADHGNGGNGKCAGCTGKADWKNPPGQYQNDHNNGYECDHNSGVGKGNPPHSQCRPPVVTTTTPAPSTTSPCPPGTCPVGGSSSPVVGGTDEPNVCVDNPNTLMDECDRVQGERFEDDVQGDEPLRNERQPTQGETLPFTGAGVISLLFLGGLMVAGGALVIQRTSSN